MQFMVSIKRKPLLAFAVLILLLGNVFLAIMYLTKPGPGSRLAIGAIGANGPIGARARGGRRARPQPQDVDEFGEPLEYYPTDQMVEQSAGQQQPEPMGPSVQDLAQMRAQPQAQMGGQGRLGAVTQGRARQA